MSAQIFKPSSSIISARFESSSSSSQPPIQIKAGLSRPDTSKKSFIAKKDLSGISYEIPSIKKIITQRRISFTWIPNSLLCKRFNITPPDTGPVTSIESKKVNPILTNESMDQMINVLLKNSKNAVSFDSSEKSNPLIVSDGTISSLPSDNLFDEIFGAPNPDHQNM